MSSKTKTAATKEESTPALVPKLRFAEFIDAAGWDADGLGKVADFVNEKIPVERVALENYVSTENILPDYGGVARASKLPTTGSVTRYRLNDTLVSNIRPYLKKVWVADKEGGASNDVIVIRAKQRLLPQYFSCLLKNDAFIDYVMTGAKGVKMPRGDIGSMKAYPTLYPSKPEQQKIAECLSSVDELIVAQARKLDALKTHKKGLMQQLFPREGETQPRLRFPEFQNAGEWETKPLGEIFPITSSKRVHESDWTAAGVPFYRAREIVALNKQEPIQPLFISEELYSQFSKLTGEIREGHLLVTGVGSIGVPYLVKKGDRFYFKDGNIIWLKNDEKQLSGEFLHRLYETDYVQKQLKTMADVGTVATYTIDNAKRTLAVYPPDPDEQQRIADCLTSLDGLIAAQTQKLEALKTHKQGLMQQLFASPEAAEQPPF